MFGVPQWSILGPFLFITYDDYVNSLRLKKFACKMCLKCWDMDYQNMLHCLNILAPTVSKALLPEANYDV